jgi:hypothetical protein
VTVVGTLDEVRLLVGERLVARHERCWKKAQVCFDPVHYLALLDRKPGALDFARPLADWELPPSLALLRRCLEADLGSEGTREYIKVLRLLENATVSQLGAAVEQALSIGATGVDAIRLLVEHRRQAPIALFCLAGRPHLKAVQVPKVDLAAYGVLAEGSA